MTPILRLVGAVAALFCAGSTAKAQGGRGAALPPATAAQPSVASSVTSPHGPALREACASCHRADGLKPARIAANFKHAERPFPLAGAHERATCMSCHTRLDFQGASTTCASCHSDPHKGEFGVTCARCHNTRSGVIFGLKMDLTTRSGEATGSSSGLLWCKCVTVRKLHAWCAPRKPATFQPH